MQIVSIFFSYVVILISTLFLPWWAVALGMAIYLLKARGWGLVPLMLVVDAYYGVLWSGPWLTISAVALVVVMSFVRPLVRGWWLRW